MKATGAAELAGFEAQTAVEAAEVAAKAAEAAASPPQPDPRTTIVGELARMEASAALRIGPRRNRWRELERFEQELLEVDQRRTALSAEITELSLERQNEPARHTAELADWVSAGSTGTRPMSRAVELDQRITELQGEYEAMGLVSERLLRERAAHVAKHRTRFASDVRKAVEEAEAASRALIDQLEQKRQELLDLRATEVWVRIFPHDSLSNVPATLNLAGARKAVQSKLLPAVQIGLEAHKVFALLREDARFCASVSTVEQAAAMEGVSSRKITGKEAVWASTDEGRAEERLDKQRRIDAYIREWGMPPPEY